MTMTRLGRPTPAVLLAACLAVAGCAPDLPPNRPAPEGQLAVMGPGPSFNLDAPPKDWIVVTGAGHGREVLSTVKIDGVPAVELKSAATPTIAVRRVDAMLLATPFLSWSWHLSDHGKGIHPVRIVVGFLGGAPEGEDTDVLGGDLPPHDRALALVWGDTMLRRGTLTLPSAAQPLGAPLYTARGGRENTRRWWLDTVDLSQFYAQAWPNDTIRRARITFIGIAAAPRMPPVRGRVSGILLSH